MRSSDWSSDVCSSDLIESVTIPKGLSEDTIRLLSSKKGEPEFMLEWRLAAYRHWLTMDLPEWAKVSFPAIDFQDISYYSAPKSKVDGLKALTKSTPNCCAPTKSWAFHCTSAPGLPAWRSTP